MKTPRIVVLVLSLVSLAALVACGGGGGSSSSSSSSSSQSQTLTITTASPLPGTLQGHSYSVTLTATGGHAPYHWSVGDLDPTHLMNLAGLSLNPETGVISGTTTSFGGQFRATVTDSSSPAQTATKVFTFLVATPLAVPATQNVGGRQFYEFRITLVGVNGGVPPFSYGVDPACLPAGMKFNTSNVANTLSNSIITGTPFTAGIYQCRINIQDSFAPPETGTMLMTIVVAPPPLSIADRSLPSVMPLNRPFSGRVVTSGGVPPYAYSMTSGSLPPGIAPLDANTGQLNGTPTATGLYTFGLKVTDSSSNPQTASQDFGITVAQPIGRNDTPATATPIGNGSFSGSISPYIDPPNTPNPGDNDYYKLASLGGGIVHVETSTKQERPGNPLDTVIEIVDGNGHPLSTCRQPGDTSTNFTSACINDDISMSPHDHDSALDFRVPGATNVTTIFYAHVFDWRGDARPDMTYTLTISGTVKPLSIWTSVLTPAVRGLTYSQQLVSDQGNGAVHWTLDSGVLPPGLALSASGTVSGTPTGYGTFSFTVRATDSANPPQSVIGVVTLQIVDAVAISSPSTLPDACVNQPYSFALQTSGGAPPFNWGFYSVLWPAINMHSGVFSGTSEGTGTFNGTVFVTDGTGQTARQEVTLTLKPCP